MAKKKKSSKSNINRFLIPGAVILVVLLGIGLVVKIILAPTGQGKKEKIQVITLIKPPPDQPKEKLPEPEVPKEVPKQTIAEPQQIDQLQDSNEPPAGADLGVEGEGGSGSDGFGLKGGINGGRSVTVGGGGNRMSLMAKYGWYNSKIQDEIKVQVRKRLEQDGKVPKGKFEAKVHIVLDRQGKIIKSQLVASSGNDKMDDVIKKTLPGLKISQPPPEGMPSGMTLRLTWQG